MYWCNWPIWKFVNRGVGLDSPKPVIPSCALCLGNTSWQSLRTGYNSLIFGAAPCGQGLNPPPQWNGRLYPATFGQQCTWKYFPPVEVGAPRHRILEWVIENCEVGQEGHAYGGSVDPEWRCYLEARCGGGDVRTLHSGRKLTGRDPSGVYTHDDTLARFPVVAKPYKTLTWTGNVNP